MVNMSGKSFPKSLRCGMLLQILPILLVAGAAHIAYAQEVMQGTGKSGPNVFPGEPVAGIAEPGDIYYPDGGMRVMDSTGLLPNGLALVSGVVDPHTGYVYAYTEHSVYRGYDPAYRTQIVKLTMGEGDAPPEPVSRLFLPPGIENIEASLLDPVRGFAYFFTDTTPPQIVKVALTEGDAAPELVVAAPLNFGGAKLLSAFIDSPRNYAYVVTSISTVDRVVKIRLNEDGDPPAIVGNTALPAFVGRVRTSVVDEVTSSVFITTRSSSATHIIRMSLGEGDSLPRLTTFTTPEPDIPSLYHGVLDATNRHLYFVTVGNTARIVKFRLIGPSMWPELVATLPLTPSGATARRLVVAPEQGYGYALLLRAEEWLFKFRLGDEEGPMEALGNIDSSLDMNRSSIELLPDPSRTYGLVLNRFLNESPVKVAFGDDEDLPGTVDPLASQVDAGIAGTFIADEELAYGFLGTQASPSSVLKIALRAGLPGASALEQVARGLELYGRSPRYLNSAILPRQEANLQSGFKVPGRSQLYFGTYTSTARVVQVAMGDGEDAPERLSSAILEGNAYLARGLHVPGTNLAYFAGIWNIFIGDSIDKVDLGSGDAAPTFVLRIGRDAKLALTLVDSVHPFSNRPLISWWYGGAHRRYGYLVDDEQIIDVNTEGFAPVPDSFWPWTGVWSKPSVPEMYTFEMAGTPRLNQLVVDSEDHSIQLFGQATIWPGDPTPSSILVDYDGGLAYGVASTGLLKFGLARDGLPVRRLGYVRWDVPSSFTLPAAGVIDVEHQTAYVARGLPMQVDRVMLSRRDYIQATRIEVDDEADVTGLRWYSHHATGNVQFALYSDVAGTPHKVWASEVLENTAQEHWLSVPIEKGTPLSLQLPPGTYWLAWQADTPAHVASHRFGTPGDGFFVPQRFDTFPSVLLPGTESEAHYTSETWSSYLVYNVPFQELPDPNEEVDPPTCNESDWSLSPIEESCSYCSSCPWYPFQTDRIDFEVAAGETALSGYFEIEYLLDGKKKTSPGTVMKNEYNESAIRLNIFHNFVGPVTVTVEQPVGSFTVCDFASSRLSLSKCGVSYNGCDAGYNYLLAYGITVTVEGDVGTLVGALEGTGNFVECQSDVEGEGEGEGDGSPEATVHRSDQNGDGVINLSELLRVIQFFNAGGLHCANPPGSTEDGYAPGANAAQQDCAPHSSDYNPQDWVISLSELLRLIQFFNTGGYFPCESGEDGFCPGTPPNNG